MKRREKKRFCAKCATEPVSLGEILCDDCAVTCANRAIENRKDDQDDLGPEYLDAVNELYRSE